jgi:hypothetical protein
MSEEFFLNNEMPERTRKNFMDVALSTRMCRACHEFFFVSISVFRCKKTVTQLYWRITMSHATLAMPGHVFS